MQSKKEKLLWIGTFIYLACYFSGLLIMNNLLIVAFGMILCGFWVLEEKKIRIDVPTCLLAFSMIGYFFNCLGMKMFTSHFLYEIMIFYVLAHYMAKSIQKDDKLDEKLWSLLILIVSCITLHAILNSYMFLAKQWHPSSGFRYWKDFWTGDYYAGTLHVNYYLPIIACLVPSLLFWEKKKLYTSFTIISCAFLMWIAVISQSRIPVVILPIAFVCQIILYGILEHQKIKESFSLKKLYVIAGIVLTGSVVLTVFFCFTKAGHAFINIWGRQGGIIHNVRFEIYRIAIQQLMVYPLGGHQMDLLEYGHAHNLWLDMADWGGLPVVIAFLCYTVITAKEIWKFLRNPGNACELKVTVFGMYLSYFLFFIVEKGLHEPLDFITPWIFLHGLLHGLVKEDKQ